MEKLIWLMLALCLVVGVFLLLMKEVEKMFIGSMDRLQTTRMISEALDNARAAAVDPATIKELALESARILMRQL